MALHKSRSGLKGQNEATITLEKHDAPTPFPDKIATGEGPVTLFDPGHPLLWRVA